MSEKINRNDIEDLEKIGLGIIESIKADIENINKEKEDTDKILDDIGRLLERRK